MTFDEALDALRPTLGDPRHIRRADPSDPECVGYSDAYWYRGDDMYRDGFVMLDDEDGGIMVYASVLGSASWWLAAPADTREPLDITPPDAAARAAMRFMGWA